MPLFHAQVLIITRLKDDDMYDSWCITLMVNIFITEFPFSKKALDVICFPLTIIIYFSYNVIILLITSYKRMLDFNWFVISVLSACSYFSLVCLFIHHCEWICLKVPSRPWYLPFLNVDIAREQRPLHKYCMNAKKYMYNSRRKIIAFTYFQNLNRLIDNNFQI